MSALEGGTGTPDGIDHPEDAGSGRCDRPLSPGMMAAAAVSGIVLVAGVADMRAGEPATVEFSAVDSAADRSRATITAQFSRAFTAGAAWDPPVVLSIKPPTD